ncbi:OFA family oxalate/formate antiporter-like MFS transporter [Aequitasia blattaphilus]|uniref:MFS transporter n=1 Tax=Aequitasia blattaphilus TaxID=2949332 RepID=A0ABT1EAU7_9FIRM|nr:MFS transporter [Aequitasia blattaphilus]MCP1102959.1 MFS transporter [Aequitasia blattaphilus]MCR8615599.1 MFS transporter [Aequitasia blattaphilus]
MKEKKIFYGWFIVIGCILITCTMVPLIMALSNKFLISITTDMGISRSAFTLVNTIVQALGILLSPMVAKRLAKGNMKKIQSICIVGFALAYASYSLAQNVYHLYISAVVLGFFYLNSTLIPVSMMITNWFVKKRGLAMSLAMAGIGLGGFLFSPVVTWLIGSYGWRWTYRIMAVLVLLVPLPTSLFILRKKPEDMGLTAYGAEEVSETASSKEAESAGGITLSVSESKKKTFFFLMLMGMFLNGIINTGALGQFPPAIEEMHGPAVQATIISLYSLIGIFGKIILGWINDRFGVIASSVFGCVTFALAFVLMLMGSNASVLYIMAFSFGLGNAIGTVSPPLIVGSIYGKEKYGEAYGIANSASQIGLSLGSLIVAGIYDLTGAYTIAWILMIVCSGLTLLTWISAYGSSRKYQGNI